jgi:DNA-binding IclR family transcriptional regulator
MTASEQAELFRIDDGAIARVAGVLRRHNGKPFAISRPALCRETGLADRTVRRTVAFLVFERGMPIVDSDDGGYYLAVTKRELASGAKHLTDKIKALALRLRRLVGSDEAARLLGQLELPITPQPPTPSPTQERRGAGQPLPLSASERGQG